VQEVTDIKVTGKKKPLENIISLKCSSLIHQIRLVRGLKSCAPSSQQYTGYKFNISAKIIRSKNVRLLI